MSVADEILARRRKSPSRAEDDVREELQRQGLAYRVHYDLVYFLTGPYAGQVFHKDDVTREMARSGELTVPDFNLYMGVKKGGSLKDAFVPGFLDGPPHLKGKALDRDPWIDARLVELGFPEPLRFGYRVPLSRRRRMEIVAEMREALNG